MKDLSKISNEELLVSVENLSRVENETTLGLLLHLNEIDDRRLYAELAYSSLFAYCTKKLKYSDGSAYRRITTARCMKKYPQIYTLLVSRDLNLSSVPMVSGILTPENVDDILPGIALHTRKEIEELVSRYREPQKRISERVTPVVVERKPATSSPLFEEVETPKRTRRRPPLSLLHKIKIPPERLINPAQRKERDKHTERAHGHCAVNDAERGI
jgi:hypothetical protein